MNRSWCRLPRRAAALLAVALLAVLAATGCGGDSASGAGSGRKVVIGFSAWPGWFPWQVAADKGLFAENGVDVQLTYFDFYTDSLNALAAGKLDANSQTLGDTLASVSGGAQERIVLVNDNSTGNDQIIARDGILEVADLKGQRIAVEQGTVDHYLLLLALREVGLSEQDITLVPLATDAAAAAFVAGKVDAVGVFAPFTTTALSRKGSRAVATSADFPGAIPDHLVFTADFVRRDPDAVQAVVKTWFDTLAWIRENPVEAVAIMAKKAGVSETEYRAYEQGTTLFTLEQNLAAFRPGRSPANLNHQVQKISEFMVLTKLTETMPYTAGLLDDRFVRKLAQEPAG